MNVDFKPFNTVKLPLNINIFWILKVQLSLTHMVSEWMQGEFEEHQK